MMRGVILVVAGGAIMLYGASISKDEPNAGAATVGAGALVAVLGLGGAICSGGSTAAGPPPPTTPAWCSHRW